MPKQLGQLTARKVEALTTPGMYADGGGLYLAVGPGSKSWIFRYQLRGKRRDMGLGTAQVVTLADARHLAHEARRRIIVDRVDPIEHRRKIEGAAIKEMKVLTFEQCAQEFLKTKKRGWSLGYEKVWVQGMQDHVYPTIGKLPVSKIDIATIHTTLKPFNGSKLSIDLRWRIAGVLDTAIGLKLYTGENAARSPFLTALLPPPVASKKQPALPYEEVVAFMAELRSTSGVSRRAVEFLILCGSRRKEVLKAKWPEVDMGKALWTIPAERMKMRRKHIVPLSGAAMAVLRQQASIRLNDYIFSIDAFSPFDPNTFLQLVKRLRPDVTLHGFRATFSDWITEATEFDRDMGEIALSHKVRSDIEDRYKRGTMVEKRRVLMNAWADYCAGIKPADNVVPLRA